MDSILHIGSIAGVPQELSSAQRCLGMKSDVLSFEYDDFGYRTDYHYPIKLDYSTKLSIYLSNPVNLLKKMPRLLPIARRYDLIHFHYSSGLPFGLDFPLWRALGKKIVMHHHGSDIRFKREPLIYSKLAQRIFVSTPDLLKWSRGATWIPNPIDLKQYPFIGAKNRVGSVKILHAPSRRHLKGTKKVLEAVQKLKDEGYSVELMLIENTPHRVAVEHYKQADIIVDQLLIGWYGMLAQECMALGKPVCVYISEDLLEFTPSNPLVNTDSSSILDNLKLLIEDPQLRADLGKKGRSYVERIHSSERIARQLMDLYP